MARRPAVPYPCKLQLRNAILSILLCFFVWEYYYVLHVSSNLRFLSSVTREEVLVHFKRDDVFHRTGIADTPAITPPAKKPRLVLHVGPMKTGTTTLQTGIIYNPRYNDLLQSDNYQKVEFHYLKMHKVRDHCFQKGPDECDYSSWNELVQVFDDVVVVVVVGKRRVDIF